MILEKLTGKKTAEVQREEPGRARTPAQVNAELAAAIASSEPLRRLAEESQIELTYAQRAFDDSIAAFALGNARAQPDRRALEAAASKHDALARIDGQQQPRIAALRSELAALELAEVVARGSERLPLLVQSAESKLIEFETSLERIKQIEKELFSVLFDEDSGLRQNLGTQELNREATRARGSIRSRLENVVIQYGYLRSLNPDFETDGEKNIGAEDEMHLSRFLRGA